MWLWIKRLVKFAVFGGLAVVVAVVICNVWVTGSTALQVYDSIEKIPENEVGVVLGTSKHFATGRENLHFRNRMEAAARLVEAGKVRHLLLSGDGQSGIGNGAYYNEPRDMRAALRELGVPDAAMTEDPGGIRTLYSIIRAKEVCHQDRFTVISDGFHVARALFIARQEGIEAVAFSSAPVELDKSFKSRVREWLARVRAVLDVHVLGDRPDFSGESLVLGIAAGQAALSELDEAASSGAGDAPTTAGNDELPAAHAGEVTGEPATAGGSGSAAGPEVE